MQLVEQASDKPYTCTLDRPATYTRHTQNFIFAFFLLVHACEKIAHQQNLSTYRSITQYCKMLILCLRNHGQLMTDLWEEW